MAQSRGRGRRKPKAVVWDLDGTLADDRARAHFVEVEQGKKRDWKSYFDAIDEDPPIAASMEVLRALHAGGLRIVFLTGRPEYTRRRTERWLKANGLTEYDRLLMRPPGDFRPSGPFKVEVIEALRREYELVCAFEDRIDVADALRGAALPVFLYGAGMEAAAEALEALDAEQDELAERREEREEEEARRPKRPAARKPARTAKPARPSRAKATPARKAAERGKQRAAKASREKKPERKDD
jgi:FMN phosphatase YigB (HAD superfamily)